MSIVSIILIALLVILLFRVGFAILRFIISAALILLGLYLGISRHTLDYGKFPSTISLYSINY